MARGENSSGASESLSESDVDRWLANFDRFEQFDPGDPPGGARPPRSGPMLAFTRGPGADGQAPPRQLKVLRWHQIEPLMSGSWLVKGALPASGVSATFGHSGCGKSFLVLDQALHIALGWEWFGRRVTRAGVVYVAAEGGQGLRNRIQAFRQQHGVAIDEDVPFALVPEVVDLFQKDVGALLNAIRAEAEHLSAPVGLIVIDTVSKTLGAGKENTDDLAVYIANCEHIAAATGSHVLLVHHRPKDSETARYAATARSAPAWRRW